MEDLTQDQKEWFGSRMHESATGRVLVASYLYKKFRKIADAESWTNGEIKDYLIDRCY